PEVAELLIKHGADVNAKTDSGFVALFWAARYGHAGVAKVLIAHGADVNAKDKDAMTALKWATTNQQAKVAELLKEAGAKEYAVAPRRTNPHGTPTSVSRAIIR